MSVRSRSTQDNSRRMEATAHTSTPAAHKAARKTAGGSAIPPALTLEERRMKAQRIRTMTVKIGPFDYTVSLCRGQLWFDDEGKYVNGLICGNTCDILISDSVPLSHRRFVLWHELGHAFMEVYSLGMSAELDGESIADAIGKGVASIDADTFAKLDALIMDEGGAA